MAIYNPPERAITQAALDSSTFIATDAYVDRIFGPGLVWFREDFLYQTNINPATGGAAFTADTPWLAEGIGSAGVISSSSSAGNLAFGVCTLGTNAAATTGQGAFIAKVGSTVATVSFGTLGSITPWDFNVALAMLSVANICVRVGFCAASQFSVDPPANGIWVEFDTANASSNTDWTWVTNKAGTGINYSTTNSSAPDSTNTNFHRLRIRSNAAGTILFSYDGGTEASISTDVPTAVLAPFVQILSRTSGQKQVNLDFISFVMGTSRT